MTKEDIIRMAHEVFDVQTDSRERTTFSGDSYAIEAFAKMVAEHEREACAEICDGFYLSWIDIQGRYEFMGEGASECAGAIRRRGQA